ncbi:amidohydrolase [Polymorphobacter glacialis]|uniref:Amidohydrolase n=1 Tax=Sandarakinorhabdus glacialis TaxID=1614636 RepID=A0A917E923_9SPHN|nr:amidohydrolase family protein [Polymorphobacter glacialis]GGE15955.1 amidohydrolase [Polymorphobacter glacialis]
MKRFGLILALLLASPATAATIAITGGTVLTAVGETSIANGTVIVRDGRIAAVGQGLVIPAGATVIDATGKFVTPGLIAGMSNLGINEVDAVPQTNDARARTSPFSAAIDIAPAINALSTPIAINRVGGVTRAVVGPEMAGEIFAGQGAIISLAATGDILLRPRAFQLIEMGEDGARIAGGSRPAAWLNLRNGFAEAQRFARNPAAFESGLERGSLIKRIDASALVPVVEGRIPAVIHAERASDLTAVLGLLREFPKLRIILIGAREGWLVADKIAAARVPVITLPLFDLPDSFETLASTRSNVGRLVAAGVDVGFGIFGGDSGTQARNLPYQAGNAVAQAAVPGGAGLTRGQALAAITRVPAQIFGLADLGTLEAGKRGDVVVWDGDPLELASAPVAVFIDGIAQPMTSRQTELRDRYRDLAPGALPFQYRQ